MYEMTTRPPGRATRSISVAEDAGRSHVLHDVARHDDVGDAVGERERLAAGLQPRGARDVVECVPVGVDGDVAGARCREGPRERRLPGAHVDDGAAREGFVLADQLGGVLGEVGVEPLRVGLLDEEGPEQADGAPERAVPSRRLGTHWGMVAMRAARRAGPLRPRGEMSLRVLLLNWRDLHHPEAGGAEKYLVTVAEGLAARGHDGDLPHGRLPRRPPRRDGCGSALPAARWALLDLPEGPRGALPRPATTSSSTCRTACRTCRRSRPATPVVNLVHHVHREQWPVVFGPRTARVGWWLESRLAPRVYRADQLRDGERLDPTRARRARRRRRAGHDHPQRHGCRRRRHRRAVTRAPRRRPRSAGAPEAGGDRPRRGGRPA